MKSRRLFLKNLGGLAALATMPFNAALAGNYRVIIVGGGVAGTRAAAYMKMSLPSASVKLFDTALRQAGAGYYRAIQNNFRPVSRDVLENMGVDTLTDRVMQIDPVEKSVFLANGKRLQADFLIIASGVDFKWDDIKGYKSGMEQVVLHAWQHPADEAVLWQQVAAMRNGEKVVISVPAAPYRFPQGPYQRASAVARYLHAHKPKSKLLVLDGNNAFPSMQHYLEQWKNNYSPGMVEWVAASHGGIAELVDAHNNTLVAAGETIKAAVLNIIPPQQAGLVARTAELTNNNSHWCQVNPRTLESSYFNDVYVIGDANDAALLNKTAASANQQALQCVARIKATVA